MTFTIRLSAVVACAAALVCLPAPAANMQMTAADIKLGGQLSGPPLGSEGIGGRVVVLEFWGINCPPCIASMPGLEELHKQLAPQGLVVIGAHAQQGSPDDVRKTVAQLGVTFPIVENATVEGGMDFEGIPHCMVFDHTGKCVYRGAPGGAHDVVMTAVQAAPGAVLGGRSLVKLTALGQMLKNESLWGAAVKKARPLVDSKDKETADEAQFVVEKVEERGRDMLTKARELAGSDPVAAATLAHRCSIAFKGGDLGKDAGSLLAEWKKDKSFQTAFKAGQQLARLQALRAAAESLPGGVPPEVAYQGREIAQSIEKICPGSDYAAKAAAIVASLSTSQPAPCPPAQ